MVADVAVLFVLLLLNGAFALSEIAVVSSRRARLQHLADRGSAGARHALALASQPTRFLSTVQIGITTVGILSGAIGEATIADRLRPIVESMPGLAPYADVVATVAMVALLTYASLIVGELVPKRLALARPERMATLMARPMDMVASVARPVVWLLSATTNGILRAFGVSQVTQPGVTVDEVRVMLKQGAEQGVFEPAEETMASNVLDLDERHVDEVMTPRSDIVYLDVRDSHQVNHGKLRQHAHDVLPLCDGGLDAVLGFVRSRRVLESLLGGQEVDLRRIAEQPLYVPERMTMMRLLEQFRQANLPLALAVDEFGGIEGLVSLTDVLSAIVGDVPAERRTEPAVVRRDDGSWLMEGALGLDNVERLLRVHNLIGDADRDHYHTLSGLAMVALGRIPRTGDTFDRRGYRFEIVDMDGNRVDRVLVSAMPGGDD